MLDHPPSQFTLRPLEKPDIAAITNWFCDIDDLSCFDRTSRIPPNLPACEKSWERAIGTEAGKEQCWFAITSGSGDVVGIIGLENISPINRDAVIPLFLDKSVRRRGVGIRATALMLDFAFHQLGLQRITSYYRADNESSRDLTRKVGFEIEGQMRRAWFAKGEFVDMMVVGLLHDEWATRRKSLVQELDAKTIVAFGNPAGSGWAWPPGNLDHPGQKA